MSGKLTVVFIVALGAAFQTGISQTIIPANDPNIQYFGRWDFTVPTLPTHSWPGVYIYAEFEGTSIGINTSDNFCYYNVFIDDTLFSIFHGDKSGLNSYTLASNLAEGTHSILFTLRNETNWTKFSFNGFILDDGKSFAVPKNRPEKKIEFYGDSYTCASGNEYTEAGAAPNQEYYTNVYEGFAPVTARELGAQYTVCGRGGFGMMLDYQGNYGQTIPATFDRTLVYTLLPKWNFSTWTPNLVVICLGLNDYNGLGGYSGPIDEKYATLYKQRYHNFIADLMDRYPQVKILAVAPNGLAWLQQQISTVVSEENAFGHTNVFYTSFPAYTGHFVNNGHLDVYAHHQIANVLVSAIDSIDAWTPFADTVKPKFVSIPDSSIATNLQFTFSVTTSKYASARYSTVDKPYDDMENNFTVTGTRTHSATVSCVQGESRTFYVRAKDVNGNETNSPAVIHFSVDTSKENASWISPMYDHSGWLSGVAPFGNDGASLYSTTLDTAMAAYFEKKIAFASIGGISQLKLNVKGHDGFVAYLNGQEIGRVNMDASTDIGYSTTAIQPLNTTSTITLTGRTTLKYLKEGENVFAVEVHSWNAFDAGVLFDCQITNGSSMVYCDYGSEWFYNDAGRVPFEQIVEKSTNGIADQNKSEIPVSMCLYSNYPNPFNPSTMISFDLSHQNFVEVKIFDVLGREVETLVHDTMNAGHYTYLFNGSRYSSGIYFYQLTAGSFVDVKKMMLAK
jgi:hypothetical protein